jgi:hypothetical protein
MMQMILLLVCLLLQSTSLLAFHSYSLLSFQKQVHSKCIGNSASVLMNWKDQCTDLSKKNWFDKIQVITDIEPKIASKRYKLKVPSSALVAAGLAMILHPGISSASTGILPATTAADSGF